MLRTLVRKLWSKVKPAPEAPPPAPRPVDNRTAFDRAVQRNPNLVPKGMTVAEFAVWCQEIGENYEAALEFYSEVLVLQDPAEAAKIAAAHPDPVDPARPADPSPARPSDPSPNGPGDPGGPSPKHPVPVPASQRPKDPSPSRPVDPKDVVIDFVNWSRRRVHPERGYNANELGRLYREYCREADLIPLKTTTFMSNINALPEVEKVRPRIPGAARDQRERRYHLPGVPPLKKVA